MRQNTIITVSLSAIGIITTVILINRRRKMNLIKEIQNKIERGEGETGTAKDIVRARALDPNYFKQVASKLTPARSITKDQADKYAKRIHGAVDQYGGIYDDEDKVVSTFDLLSTKAQVSYVAYIFNTRYQTGLGQFLLRKIDKDVNLDKIYNHIKSLPDY